MSKILIIAEKPKLAKDHISSALGNNWKKYKTHWENDNIVLSWTFGHIFELITPGEYDEKFKNWNLEHYPCIPENFISVLTRQRDEKGKIIDFEKTDPGIEIQFNFLKKMIKSNEISEVVSAGDPDEEGEAIVRDILDKAGCKKPMTRMWFNDTTKKTIKDSFDKRKDIMDYNGWCEFARARKNSDWLFGLNFSPLVSVKYLQNSYTSVGRVQSPLVKIIVDREIEIENFKPEQYFLTRGDFETSKGEKYKGILIDEKNTPIQSKNPLKLTTTEKGTIDSITKQEKQTFPAKAHTSSTARTEISKRLKVNVKKAEEILQSLYEKGVISYPRGETEYIPDTMVDTVKARVEKVLDFFPKKNLKTTLNISKSNKNVFQNEDSGKIGSHYAIIPTEDGDFSKINGIELQAFELICDRLLVSLMPPYTYLSTTMITKLSSGEKFRTIGNAPIDLGWKSFSSSKNEEDEETIPVLEKNDLVDVLTLKDEENWTKPPSRFKESDLEKVMKEIDKYVVDKDSKSILKKSQGIGTPASRIDIIEKIKSVGLVENKTFEKTAYIVPTEKGRLLIKVSPPSLVDPITTADWQTKLEELKEKNINHMVFVKEIIKEVIKMSDEIKNDKRGKVTVNEENNKTNNNVKKVVGVCPICGGEVIDNPKTYGCSNWNKETNPCKFTIWKNNFERLGKKNISIKECETLLKEKKIEVTLKSKSGNDYTKIAYLKIDEESKTSKIEIDFESNPNNQAQVEKKILGTCPICQNGNIVENPKTFGCSNWNKKEDPCKFTIWKNSFEKFKAKPLTEKNILNLLKKGEDIIRTEKGDAKITIDEKYGVRIGK